MSLRKRVAFAEVLLLASAVVVYFGVTAQASTTTISLPLPSGPTVLWATVAALFGEVGRRILKRLDAVVESCSKLGGEFTEFRATINTALMGPDEQGGLLGNDRENRRRIESLERKTEGL